MAACQVGTGTSKPPSMKRLPLNGIVIFRRVFTGEARVYLVEVTFRSDFVHVKFDLKA